MTEEMYKDYEDRLKQLCTRFFLPEFKEFACEVLLNKYKPTNIVSLVQYDENIDRAYFLLSPNIVFPKAYEIHTCSKKLRVILTKASPLHICLMRRQSWQNPL